MVADFVKSGEASDPLFILAGTCLASGAYLWIVICFKWFTCMYNNNKMQISGWFYFSIEVDFDNLTSLLFFRGSDTFF